MSETTTEIDAFEQVVINPTSSVTRHQGHLYRSDRAYKDRNGHTWRYLGLFDGASMWTRDEDGQESKTAWNITAVADQLGPITVICPAFAGDGDLCAECGDARRWHRAATSTRRLFGPDRIRPGYAEMEWAVWVIGPDDILQQPDLETALAVAAEYNGAFADMYDGHPLTPVMHALVLHHGYAWQRARTA